MPETSSKSKGRAGRRLSINLPEASFESLEHICDESGRSMTEIVGYGLGLTELAFVEMAKGNKLAVVNESNEVQTLVWLPRLTSRQAPPRAAKV